MAQGSPGNPRNPVNTALRWLFFLVAVACLGLGLVLAGSHPVRPMLVSVAFLSVLPLFAWRPWVGVLSLPALLPVLNFSPWTGWLIVDEFDLLVLAVISCGYFRMWRDGSSLKHGKALAALIVVVAWLIGHGLSDVSLQDISWFSGYMTPLNTLRVGKSLLWVTLLLPLMAGSTTYISLPQMLGRFFWASLLGSGWVVLAVVWERAFYPGLLDIYTPYRTVGLFWEMHHGGAALDVYLVLIAPLLVWAWQRTLPPIGRLLLGLFILAFVYVVLTTFSRGVVFAAGGALIFQWLLQWWQTRKTTGHPSGIRSSSMLILALVFTEIFLVFATDSFMTDRLHETKRDFGGRLEHWKHGLGLLKSPADWLFGIGLGKLPQRQTEGATGDVRPGGFEIAEFAEGVRGGRLSGPDQLLKGKSPGRFFALSQRFDPDSGNLHRFSMKARGEHDVVVLVQLCASHLLYPSRCHGRILTITGGEWQSKQVNFPAAVLRDDSWWSAMAHGVFLLSVLTPEAVVEIEEIRLDAGGRDLLANPRFKETEGRWFTQSFHYFRPWHIDNLYLELLIETGASGLLAFLIIVFRLTWGLFRECSRGETFSTVLLSSTAGLLALGLLVSVLDMPRVAVLSGLFFVWAVAIGSEEQRSKKLF